MSEAGGARNDALDGLRLLAVAGVLAFHYGVPGARAGFLGVDLFFVLSGYLITSLLLSELERGRVRLGQFWTRRARRLVPALVPVVAMLVWGAVFAPAVLRDRLRADIASTLFYFANWHFIASSSYFASDGVRSPLEHMWSLAVEEQFYLVWPLLLAFVGLALRRPRHRLLAVGALAAAGIAFSAWRLESLWSSSGVDRAYLGTDSRIFEPLAGALLAVVLTSPRVRRRIGRLHRPLLVAGVACLAWAMASLGGAGGATTAYFHGGALVVAAGTAAVIAAVSTATSPASRILSAGPVAYLGRLSYGIYLWHWPLWVWTQPGGWIDLTGLGKPLLAVLLTVTTVALAAASYSLVESPVRYGRVAKFLAPRRTLVALGGVLLALFVVNDTTVVPYAGAALGRTTKTIVLVGDSVPQRLAPDLAAAHGYVVISATRGSCPATGVALVNSQGKPWGPGPLCATDVPARQDAAVARYRPALVIWWSRYELADRIDARGRPVRFASSAYWTLQKEAFDRRAAALTRDGAVLVTVQIERAGLGIRTRCRPSACGPFLARLVHDAVAQDTWNAFLASPRIGAARCGRSASSRSSATTPEPPATTGSRTGSSPGRTARITSRRSHRPSPGPSSTERWSSPVCPARRHREGLYRTDASLRRAVSRALHMRSYSRSAQGKEQEMPGGRPKELERRHDGDGLDVALTWRRADGRLTVVVTDQAGHQIKLPARSDNALDVYYHPFAYADPAALQQAA